MLTDKMKVVIINGSYHRKGMTSALIESFVKGIRHNKKAKIRHYFLIDIDFGFCEGCYKCIMDNSKIGKCPMDDNIGDILQQMREADLLVFASPIYEFGPTAIMKKFFERSLPLLGFSSGPPKPRNPLVKGKKGVVILSSGAPFPFNYLLRMTSYPSRVMRFFLKAAGCSKIYRIYAGGMESKETYYKKYTTKAYRLGKKITR